jgi:RNAse (barnase) inhibitor barstar
MAAWDPADLVSHSRDFRLVGGSFVTMFWHPVVLQETTGWLKDHGYHVTTLDASGWTLPPDMHRELAAALEFPDYYGHNLAALNDCMRDVAAGDYGAPADATGLVLVLMNFDTFAASNRPSAQALLDIFALQARNAALFGHRMICLVQSADPELSFEPVGATPVVWNDAEWLNAKRGP